MTRNALLDAAECVLFEDGTQALTLASVAERAGVSKGGLLYHFPTKEALLTGLIERVIAEFDALVARHDDGTPGSYTRAYVEATFEILTDGENAGSRRRWSAITAAATGPELGAPLNAAMTRWHRRDPAEDPDPLAALVVRLAAEGLWEVLSHDPDLLDADGCRALKQRLLSMLDS
ncbi:TetR/AcrR family transcriptional regulator [Actinomadura craniellae]|uniref:TetR/AcrR family transcriptional regulator n=1 Tax=Actinomadura craniellae TaxID=2231787 RepID=A0A365GZT6_9ACTN|nr:TetR/AcrR family transcriptional regulator [Actinomadura craniellae]RAY12355.1 TetR/AcrR family transcriptional regulator [Actinomadura craniellae]